MSKPHRRFAAWIRWTKWSQTEAAEKLDCHHSMISLLARGGRSPGLHTAHVIEQLSVAWPKGPIRTEEWDDELRGQRTATKAA